MSEYVLRKDIRKIEWLKPIFNRTAVKIATAVLRTAMVLTPLPRGVTASKEYITGHGGKRLRLWVYSPGELERPAPCLMFLHGGAFALCASPYHRRIACEYALRCGCKTVFVDYTLSTAEPFPAATDDCASAYRWILDNAQRLGVDPKRVAVCGDSAGGALAAGVCVTAKKRGTTMPCFQLLVYPVLARMTRTASMEKYTDTPVWNAVMNEKMWRLYLADGPRGRIDEAAPMDAPSVEGLPPAYIETAEFDCLHDEGVRYAWRLRREGIPTVLEETRGTVHGYEILYRSPLMRECMTRRVAVLNGAFRPSPKE